MSQPPFNFAGAAMAAALQPLDLTESLLRPPPPAPVHGSRRHKLWEISHKFHCPIIGVCFSVGELRTLMSRVMHFPAHTSDYVLHTTAVGACEERSQRAEWAARKGPDGLEDYKAKNNRSSLEGLPGLRRLAARD